MNENTAIEKSSRRRSSLIVENDSNVVVEIQDDAMENNRGVFPLFSRNKNETGNEGKDETMDMKVPFNNRYKYRHGGAAVKKNAEFEEESLVIENNLTEDNNDSKR